MEIMSYHPDKNTPQMLDLKKKTTDAITLGETCKTKRDSNPECNFKLVHLSGYD